MRSQEKKLGRSRAQERLLLTGVLLVVAFWGVESILDTFVFGEGDLLRTLSPTSLEELWNRGLLAVVLLASVGNTQKVTRRRPRESSARFSLTSGSRGRRLR